MGGDNKKAAGHNNPSRLLLAGLGELKACATSCQAAGKASRAFALAPLLAPPHTGTADKKVGLNARDFPREEEMMKYSEEQVPSSS